jgi:hypothetical protein
LEIFRLLRPIGMGETVLGAHFPEPAQTRLHYTALDTVIFTIYLYFRICCSVNVTE